MLGPVEVWQDGRAVDTIGRRGRFVLGLLLFNSGRLTSAENIIDALWPHDPPPTARPQLHNLMGQLRRTLGDALVTRPAGYEVALDGCTVDLHEFRSLVTKAGTVDHASAVVVVSEALAMWRGPALADLDTDLVGDMRAALHEEWLGATEILLGAELALGQHENVLDRLPGLLAEAPYRERLHEFRIRALRAAGDNAGAFAAYDDSRARFVDELGIEPGPGLRALAAELAGARRTPQQLPPVAPVLTGRAAMLAEITGALGTGGVAVLVGPAGAGKTTVAVAAAHELRLSYPDGQLYAELRGSRPNPVDPYAVLARFVRSIAPDGTSVPADPEQRLAAFREHLAGRRVLIVLDDAANENQVRPLLAPGCAVLVTSRQRLGGLPGVTSWSVPMLAPDDSVALLTRLIGQGRVAEAPDEAARIAALCGHSPLGVCIAGARLGAHRELPLAEFRDRLAKRSQRLDELAVGDLDVRATIALSYEALDEGARRLFRRLGLVTAPDWPEWVAGAPVGSLVDGHLVESAGVDRLGQCRYRLHDLVADFARERLADEDTDGDVALVELIEQWHALAADADERLDHGAIYRAGLPVPPPPFPVTDPQGWFEVERASIVAAVEEAVRIGAGELAARLALRSCGYYGVRAYDEERSHMLSLVAEAPLPDQLLVRVQNALFATYQQQSRYLELSTVAAVQLATARRLGDPSWELLALSGSGFVARSAGRLGEAAKLHEEAVTLARQTAGGTALTNNLVGLADVYAEAGLPERGLPLFEEVLEIERDDRSRLRATLLHSYGMALVDAGRFADAIRVLTDGVAVATALDDEFGVATLSQKIADAELRSGLVDSAAARLTSCLRTHERLHNDEGVAWTLRSQSDVAVATGRWADAVGILEQVLEIQLQIGEPLEIARTLDRLARALTAVGAPERAAPHRAECAAILAARGLGDECLDHPPRV